MDDQQWMPLLPAAAGDAAGHTVLRGIPFTYLPVPQDTCRNLAPCGFDSGITVGAPLAALFFLGMTTARHDGCEWWGPNERHYVAHGLRLFIGDRLGKIQLIYGDGTADIIPILMGVNVWPYELFSPRTVAEAATFPKHWGPFPEPFASDAQARALLDASLVLLPNDAGKSFKYIFGVRPRPQPLARIDLCWEFKHQGWVVSAITGLRAGAAPPAETGQLYDAAFFFTQRYFPAMDRLARRLYQFRDELPRAPVSLVAPPAGGPRVVFRGNVFADMLTNVYTVNMADMAGTRVDEDGTLHTSAPRTPCFGFYFGFGTFLVDQGIYWPWVWSRDVGKEMVEIIDWAGAQPKLARGAEYALRLLYSPNTKVPVPCWKRIANAHEAAANIFEPGGARLDEISNIGKENDGHAQMMLFVYHAYLHGVVDVAWLRAHWPALCDAAGFFEWQAANPGQSAFDGTFSSETESATQLWGGHDLLSNMLAVHALNGFAAMADAVGDAAAARWRQLAGDVHSAVLQQFVTEHPRYGAVFVDLVEDCWTYEYKRFAYLFTAADMQTYDLAREDRARWEMCRNTYLAQKHDGFFQYASGKQMGYGQAYAFQAAILLDEMDDVRGFAEETAALCYHHTDWPYLVPEGVNMHPSGRYWYRHGDLGSGVHQADILKCCRLLIGLDDLQPARGLRLVPRLPAGWSEIAVERYPVAAHAGGQIVTTTISYRYRRVPGGYAISISTAQPIAIDSLRVGPFAADVCAVSVAGASVPCRLETIGDNRFAYLDMRGHTGTQYEVTVTGGAGMPAQPRRA